MLRASSQDTYVADREEERLSRRSLLRAGIVSGAGLAAAALLGCSGDDDERPSESPAATAPSSVTPYGSKEYKDFVASQNANRQAEGAPYPYQFAEPDKAPRRGGTLIHGNRLFTPGPIDPNESIAIYANNINSFCANKLVGMVTGPKLNKYKIETQPELAQSWETSPDGLRYTFRLQPNVKYQNVPPLNGRALVANDIALALQRFAKSTVSGNYFALVDAISAPDDKTLRITRKVPDATFLQALSLRSISIYPPEVYDQGIINTKPIGTGPGILESIGRDQTVVFKSNPDYWRHAPYLDGAEIRLIPEVAALLAAFRADQIAVYAPLQLEIDALARSNPEAVIMQDPPGDYAIAQYFNVANPKFADVRVRRALSLAIDRDKAVQVLLQGRGKALPTFPWSALFDKLPGPAELGPWWKYDPAQAKQLLAAAGAEKLEFSIVPVLGSTVFTTIELYTDMLREIGVTMKLRQVEAAEFQRLAFRREFVTKGAAGGEMIVIGASQYSPFGHFYDQVHSQSIRNQGGIRDPEIDEWATQQRSELDAQKRKELQRKIWNKTLDLVFYITEPKGYETTAIRPWLRHYRFNGSYISYHYIHEIGRGFEDAWIDK